VAACAAALVAANVVLFAMGRLPRRDGGLPDWTGTLGLLAAVAITFAMYSMLYKDNPLFRAAENLFVGLGLGTTFWAMWYQFFKPDVYDRLIVPAFDPTAHVLRSDLVLIIPLFLGALVLVRVSPKHGWISRYPIAFLVGYWSGYSIQPTFTASSSSRSRRRWCPSRCTGSRGRCAAQPRWRSSPPPTTPPGAGRWGWP
jgi:hypothetical protein